MGFATTERQSATNGQEAPARCIFCSRTDLSETHTLPHWLDAMYPDASLVCGTQDRRSLTRASNMVCTGCNTGWIRRLDDAVATFLVPALNGEQVELTAGQTRTLAGWLCLIATKAAFLVQHCGISRGARTHLRHEGEPPRNWSIFAAGLSGTGWSRACAHHSSRIEFSGHPLTRHSRGEELQDCNTQLLAIGMGPLFFQLFSSPSHVLMNDFAASARAQGLAPIWPLPRKFGLLPSRHVTVPPALSLSDEQAATIADGFAGRLRERFRLGQPA